MSKPEGKCILGIKKSSIGFMGDFQAAQAAKVVG
jgi:hypothetical protein